MKIMLGRHLGNIVAFITTGTCYMVMVYTHRYVQQVMRTGNIVAQEVDVTTFIFVP